MADENEINTGPSPAERLNLSKGKFLPRRIVDESSIQPSYQLGKEFKKTKRNISPLFYVILLGFLGLLIFVTLGLSSFIHKSYQAGIGIDLIKDVQIKDLLSKGQDTYRKFKVSVQNIDELRKEKEEELSEAREDYQEALQKIKAKKLVYKEQAALVRKRTSKFKKEYQAIRKEYNARVRLKQAEARKLERKAKQNERILEKKIAQAKEAASNFEQLQQLKLRRQLFKFNPIVRKPTLKKILKEKNEFSSGDSVNIVSYTELAQSRFLPEPPFQKRLADIKKRNALVERLLAIPYTHSIPVLLKRLDSLNKSIVQNYEKTWFDLYTHLKKNTQDLNDLLYALAHLAKNQKKTGYVLDPRDTQNIRLYINENAKVPDAAPGLLVRDVNDAAKPRQEIARVLLFRVGEKYLARLVEMIDDDESIQPFDVLVLPKDKKW